MVWSVTSLCKKCNDRKCILVEAAAIKRERIAKEKKADGLEFGAAPASKEMKR